MFRCFLLEEMYSWALAYLAGNVTRERGNYTIDYEGVIHVPR